MYIEFKKSNNSKPEYLIGENIEGTVHMNLVKRCYPCVNLTISLVGNERTDFIVYHTEYYEESCNMDCPGTSGPHTHTRSR